MRENLVQYVNLLFAGTPGNDEIRQEILQNTLDRYDDLIAQGKTPEAAYQLAISGIGDINEIFAAAQEPSAPTPPPTVRDTAPETPQQAQRRKLATGLAIALFILCPVPLFLIGGTVGLCLLLALVAAGVALLVIFDKDDDKDEDEDERECSVEATPKQKFRKALSSISGIFLIALYLFISISTDAWGITWIIFPIWGCLSGLVNAIIDYKEANKYE